MAALPKRDEDIESILTDIKNEIGDIEGTSFASRKSHFIFSNPFKSNKIKPDVSLDSETENTKNYNFLNLTESKKIEEEIAEMREELKKSQQFFVEARDALESINFENIKHRIADLHIYPDERKLEEILEDLGKKRDLNKNIIELTKIIGEKFDEHPGEFGDIPEMSSFFKVCTQLRKGLDDLDKKKASFDSLGKRIIWATNVSENRSRDIKKILAEQRQSSPPKRENKK